MEELDQDDDRNVVNSEEESDDDDRLEILKKRSRKFMIIGSDGLCTEDHLSHCPDLCLLKIFQHLTRRDLFNVMKVNKRVLPLYFDQSLDKRKWNNGHLSIYPTLSGYFFDLVIGMDEYPWSEEELGNYAWYEYEISKSEDGGFIEKRTMNARRSYFVEFPPDKPHDWPIPDQFFGALSDILRHHEAMKVRVDNVPISIFTKLEKILDGHKTQSISCARIQYESIDDVEIETIKRSFVKLVKHIRIIDLKDAPELIPFVDEDFFLTIGQSEIRDRQLLTSPYAELAYVHRFFPSESMLIHLIHFQWLELLSIVLYADWVAPLIMARMDAAIKDESEQRGNSLSIDQSLPNVLFTTESTSSPPRTRADMRRSIPSNI